MCPATKNVENEQKTEKSGEQNNFVDLGKSLMKTFITAMLEKDGKTTNVPKPDTNAATVKAPSPVPVPAPVPVPPTVASPTAAPTVTPTTSADSRTIKCVSESGCTTPAACQIRGKCGQTEACREQNELCQRMRKDEDRGCSEEMLDDQQIKNQATQISVEIIDPDTETRNTEFVEKKKHRKLMRELSSKVEPIPNYQPSLNNQS